MKQFVRSPLARLIPILAGGVGLGLRVWLFSTGVDEKGLLLSAHPANYLSCVLVALFMLWLFLTAKMETGCVARVVPVPAAIGGFAAAAGILVADITEYVAIGDRISLVCCVLGLIAAGCLVYAGVCRLRGRGCPWQLHAAASLYFALHLVLQFRAWSPDPELQRYAYALFASVFLMLTAYHRATLDAGTGKYGAFTFCSRAALFFCVLSLYGQDWLFYLTMALWTAAGSCCSMPEEA